jgi:hypothetical protein
MEAVRTSETSVNFNVSTWRYIPEDSKLHTCRYENLKSQVSSELCFLGICVTGGQYKARILLCPDCCVYIHFSGNEEV